MALESSPRRGRGRPPRTDAERAAQRARLLESSMAALRRLGPDASVDQLAAAAGVSKPVLYDEFGGKEGIADAISVELTQRVEREFVVRLAVAGTIDIESSVKALIGTLFDLLTEETEVYGFVARCVRSSDRRLLDNGFVRALDSRVQEFGKLIAPDIDPDMLTLLGHGVLGFIIFAVESWQARQAPPREEIVDSVLTILRTSFGPARANP